MQTREPKPQFSEFAVYTSEERSKNTHGLVEKMLNSASQKRPNSENQTRLCCLHDLYQIRNIVIFVMIVEFESACKHSAHLQPHSCYEKPFFKKNSRHKALRSCLAKLWGEVKSRGKCCQIKLTTLRPQLFTSWQHVCGCSPASFSVKDSYLPSHNQSGWNYDPDWSFSIWSRQLPCMLQLTLLH